MKLKSAYIHSAAKHVHVHAAQRHEKESLPFVCGVVFVPWSMEGNVLISPGALTKRCSAQKSPVQQPPTLSFGIKYTVDENLLSYGSNQALPSSSSGFFMWCRWLDFHEFFTSRCALKSMRTCEIKHCKLHSMRSVILSPSHPS